MKSIKIRRNVVNSEEVEVQISEVSYKKDSLEVYMIDARDEKLLIKGVMWQKEDRQMTMEVYQEEELFKILEKNEATEAQWNAQLEKAQEFLKVY